MFSTSLLVAAAFAVIYFVRAAWTSRSARLAKQHARRLSEESCRRPDLREKSGKLSDDAAKSNNNVEDPRIAADKRLYHELQNLEDYPGAVDAARARLRELFDHTLSQPSPILAINRYTSDALRHHFDDAHVTTTGRYEAYLLRRRAGGARELFRTRADAMGWLALAAPVKYVDGGWLGSVMRCADGDRRAARQAWQVMSEEFGDGDLAKNHVKVFRDLVGGPAGDDAALLLGGGPGSRCWAAAVAQQCIGLLAHDYLPEALGFNMAYEALPYHLLVTSRELRELGIDDYYFALHVTIDNADSGHAALARDAVETYLEGVRARGGDVDQAWRRVQAGVVLADGIPTTPYGPRDPAESSNVGAPPPPTPDEATMVAVLQRKAPAAARLHCPSRAKIGGMTIEEWLAPPLEPERALGFLRALGPPWVVKGRPDQSRFMRELEWGGRMFGAFSRDETALVRGWISGAGSYDRFVGRVDVAPSGAPGGLPESALSTLAADHFARGDIDGAISRFHTPTSPPCSSPGCSTTSPAPALAALAMVWYTYLSLLDHFPLSPAKFATPLGATVLRVMRAQLGLPPLHAAGDICAGTDTDVGACGLWEIGRDAFARHGVSALARLAPGDSALLALAREPVGVAATFCADLLTLRSRPYASHALLLGVTHGLTAALLLDPLSVFDTGEREMAAQSGRDIVAAIDAYVASTDAAWRSPFDLGRLRAQKEISIIIKDISQ